MLRREMHAGVAQEVANLRTEVHALRNEARRGGVGGQLRLERIETTRLIGSDLEAVQSELRKLRETTYSTDVLAQAVAVPIPVSTVRTDLPEESPDDSHDDIHDEIHDAEIVGDAPEGRGAGWRTAVRGRGVDAHAA